MKRNRLLKPTNIRKFGIFAAIGLWGLFFIALVLLINRYNKPANPLAIAQVKVPVLAKIHPAARQIEDIDRQLLVLDEQLRRAGGIVMPDLLEIKLNIIPLPALTMPQDIKVTSKGIEAVTEIEKKLAEAQLKRKYDRLRKIFSEAAVNEMEAAIAAEKKKLDDDLLIRNIKIAIKHRIPVRSTEINKDNAEMIRLYIESEKMALIKMTTEEKDKARRLYEEELANAKYANDTIINELIKKLTVEMENKIREYKKESDIKLAAELAELLKKRNTELKDNRLISPPESPRSAPTPPNVSIDDNGGDAKDAANLQRKNDIDRNNKVISQTQASMKILLQRRKIIEELIKKDTEQAVKTLGELHGFDIRYSGADNAIDITPAAAGWLSKYWGK